MKESTKVGLLFTFMIISCLSLTAMVLPLEKIIIQLVGVCVITVTIMFGLIMMTKKK